VLVDKADGIKGCALSIGLFGCTSRGRGGGLLLPGRARWAPETTAEVIEENGRELARLTQSSAAWKTSSSAMCCSAKPSALSTSTEILMSPVVITFMFTPAADRAENMRSATPVCVRMAGADDRHLADVLLVLDRGAQLRRQRPQHRQGGWQLVFEHGEADGRPTAQADVLRDHVHDDVLFGDAVKTRWLTPGSSGHAVEIDAGLVLDDGGAAHRHAPHPLGLGHDPGALDIAERRALCKRTANFLANSMLRECSTLAPTLASSSISS